MDESSQKNNNRAAGTVTLAALISILVYSFVVSLPGVLINEVVEEFSLSGADEGLMGTLTSLGFLLSLFFVIMVQGRAQKITVLLISCLVQAVTLSICGFSPTFLILCIGCVFVGFSGGFIDTGCNSSIVDVRKLDSTKYLGYLHGLFGIGSLLTPLVFLWVLRYTDWRGIHYALAVASALIVLLIFPLTRGTGKKSDAPVMREHLFTKSDLLTYLRVKRNVFLALAGFFSMFSIASVMVWIVRYMTLRFDAEELGMLSISVYWVCATINRFTVTRVFKLHPMKLCVLGAIFSGASLIIGVFSGNAIVLCVMLGVFGLCSGHFIPVLISECAVGYEGRTTFTTSLLMFVMSVSRIAAPVMMAFIGTQISLTLGMMLPVVTALVTACCGWFALRSA
jgi:MFS family permease